jgi:RHS repeat-associated protein
MNTKQKTIFQGALIILFLHTIFANVMMLQAQINTTLPVGAIPGVIDVSPMGAATYTIPIEVVPGTQGMQPNLSVVYNSFSGMGLLGMKWSLAGLSAISRCGQNPYYDGEITTIEFNNKDRFSLDGNQLVNISSGSYGGIGNEYATEMENFTRVVSYNGTAGHPAHFKAYTDDGSIIEYGNTTDSKQKMNNTDKILCWLINRITDFNGNYLTFHYAPQVNNEIWIDSICYTGNANNWMQPYAKVKFDYTTNTLNRNTYFVGGYGIPQNKLLDFITVYYSTTVVRKYQFNYNLNDSEERTAHLKEIKLYGEGGNEPLNATTIEWGVQNTTIDAPQINGLPQGTQSGTILTGDFDGDGYTDVILYGTGSSQNIWKLYLYDPVSNSFSYSVQGTHQSTTPSTPSSPKFYSFMKGEKNMLVIAEKETGNNMWNIRGISFNPYTEYNIGTIPDLINIYCGKFSDYKYEMVFLRSPNNISYEFVYSDLLSMLSFSTPKKNDPYKIHIADMTGNGLDNIQIVKEPTSSNTNTAFTYENFQLIREDGFPTIWHHVYYGDFNGDGMKDALVYTSAKQWLLHVGTGNCIFIHPGQNITQLDATPENNTSRPLPKHPVIVADVNGDGKDEIIQGVYLGNFKTRLDFYFLNNFSNNGLCSLVRKQYTVDESCYKMVHYNLGEFNNDGRADIFMRSSIYDMPRIVYINKNEQHEFLNKITDGMKKTIKLSYNPSYYFAENITFFSSFTISCYKKYFLPVIESLQVSNGIENNLNTFNYFFEEPAFSYRRNCFLGFRVFKSSDILEDKNNFLYHKFDDSSYTDQFGFNYENREILVSTSHHYFLSDELYNTITSSPKIKTISRYPHRYVSYFDTVIVKNYFSDTKTLTTTMLNAAGRDSIINTTTYNSVYDAANYWLHAETKTCTYQRVLCTNNRERTVPERILTIQQYKKDYTQYPAIADTLTYGYYPNNNPDKGRLNWQRQGNIDGSITTTYGNYSVTGVYREKTVSAAGCNSRTEIYEHDPTRRFVSKVITPDFPNFASNFEYDPKTGNKLTETDINGLTTTYNYDNFGRFKQINYPDGTITKDTIYWYAATYPKNARYCTKTTSSGKPDLIVYYDILGREVCNKNDGYYYETKYNNKGQVVKTSYPFSVFYSPDTVWTYYTYDDFGRLTNKVGPYTNLIYYYNYRWTLVVDSLRNERLSFKEYDALGRIVIAQDNGGDIRYSYSIVNTNNKLRHKTIITASGATTTIETDLWGNRLKITDPNAGTITSTYNKFNELIKQTDARKNTTTYEYDVLGRITQKKFDALHTIGIPDDELSLELRKSGSDAPPESEPPRSSPQSMTINYTYDNYNTYNRGRGKLHEIKIDSVYSEIFGYDSKSRLNCTLKIIDDLVFDFLYNYDVNGQLKTLIYPDFAVDYYYEDGKLSKIQNNSNNKAIYQVLSRNKYQETLSCRYGNFATTDYTYNPYGLLTRIYTNDNRAIAHTNDLKERAIPRGGIGTTLLDYGYTYNPKGLMASRTDSVMNRFEAFSYDNLDRLTQFTSGKIGQTGYVRTFDYEDNGNIANNSQVGAYAYDSNKPHAVAEILPVHNRRIFPDSCQVTYNYFNQPIQIEEGDYRIELFYGADQQRNKAVRYKNGTKENTHYYINKYYEKEIDHSTGVTRHYSYIYGDHGVVALHITTQSASGTADSIYYIHTDHLGSYCALTNASGKVVQRNIFDPWGNFYSFNNAIVDSTNFPFEEEAELRGGETYPQFKFTCRGFTGHEHYPEFRIINMNGRLYDPVIARFFSPDKYVANSSFTQDFNRYSYARNNPLMYTDPSGEIPWFIPVVIGAVWCAIQGGIIAQQNGATGWNAAGYILGGAAIGAITGIASYGIGLGVATAGFGAVTGTASGAFSGLMSGTLGGFGMSALAGKSSKDIYYSTLYGGLFGMGMGAFMGGISDISNALIQRAIVFSAAKELGIKTGEPIPKFLRNKEFVKHQIKRFHGAKEPDNIFIEDGGSNLTDDNNVVHAGSVKSHPAINNKFTGGSDMYLHEKLAFTSLKKFYNVLGHELFHVSQYAALAGQNYVSSNSFTNMLEYYANSFSNSYSWGWGYYSPTTLENSSSVSYHNLVSNFGWTKNIYVPGNSVLDFLNLRP